MRWILISSFMYNFNNLKIILFIFSVDNFVDFAFGLLVFRFCFSFRLTNSCFQHRFSFSLLFIFAFSSFYFLFLFSSNLPFPGSLNGKSGCSLGIICILQYKHLHYQSPSWQSFPGTTCIVLCFI